MGKLVYTKSNKKFPMGNDERRWWKSPNRIKQRRLELGMTQEDLARRLNITTSYLSKIENERRRINVSLAIRIARALNTTVEEIFFD